MGSYQPVQDFTDVGLSLTLDGGPGVYLEGPGTKHKSEI